MVRDPPTNNQYHHTKGVGKIQSLIPWIGGKQALCRTIISRFPTDFQERPPDFQIEPQPTVANKQKNENDDTFFFVPSCDIILPKKGGCIENDP